MTIPYSPGTFHYSLGSLNIFNTQDVLVKNNIIIGNHKGIYAEDSSIPTFLSSNILIEGNVVMGQEDHCISIGTIGWTGNDDGLNPRWSYDAYTVRGNTFITSAVTSIHSGAVYAGHFGRRVHVENNYFSSGGYGIQATGTYGGSIDPGTGGYYRSNSVEAGFEPFWGSASEYYDLTITDNNFNKPLHSMVANHPGGIISNNLIDSDVDGVTATIDNCPAVYNPGQEDADGDAIGDACDDDDDNDGLSDSDELTAGTDPLDSDTDDDGLSDYDELTSGTNPLDSDSDDDRFIDRAEMFAGTDPTDDADFPEWGDINGDGSVNVADVLLATRALTGMLTLNISQLALGNVAPLVNGIPQSLPNDPFTTADLLLIQRKALGAVSF